MSTTLVSSFSRTDEFPLKVAVTAENNKGYITVDTTNFTAQMFYELPSIKFEIYTQTNGEFVKYKNFCKIIETYNPIFPLSLPMLGTIDIKDVPNEFYVFITPLFDNNSIPARNELIRNGIEDGEIWDTITNVFDLTVTFNEYTEPDSGG